MRFGAISIDEAEGTILAHKIFNNNGRLLFNKGRILSRDDIETLRDHQHEMVIVAQIDTHDVHENEAARRVGEALAGHGINVKAPGVGRANLMASERGVLRVNVPVLERLNTIYDGITIATLHEHTLVDIGDLVTLVKIVPFAVPDARIKDVECIAAEANSIVVVRPLKKGKVALIISGHESVKERLINGFHEPVKNRIDFLGSDLLEPLYVAHDATAIAHAIQDYSDCDLILIASMSAIIDREDIVPSALLLAGGSITQHGVPVDPGTLLMMGYLGDVPVVGAPGCVKSPKTNVIDWILPRLLAGERLSRADLVAMGHGGLLKDIPERPMPRNLTDNTDES
ncbi:MAG: molybdopterin-binding protein [Anaerolineae bacterium]|nr:molybdopterin-binding protein [Anaerolineae bacterium]MDQ7036313.1 molybdopterin-binding protein [Anaerolineae bacterium]